MKYIRVTLILGLLLTSVIAFSYPQRVFIEDFSSATCGPCATQIPYFETFLENHSLDEVVAIVYHMNWPAPYNDPYYIENPTPNTQRRSYYGVNTIPMYYIDGTINSYRPSDAMFTTTVNNRIGRVTPYNIEIDPVFAESSISVSVDVTFDDAIENTTILYIALVEEYGVIASSWVAHEFSYSMLDMKPSGGGISVNSEGGGETQTFEQSFDFNSEWDIENLSVISWLQESSSHEVVQSVIVEIPANVPYLSLEEYAILDDEQATPNGRPDTGETVDITLTLDNNPQFLATANLVGTLSCDNENVVIDDGDATWATIEPGAQGTNSDDPFTISVPENFEEDYVTFTLDLSDDSGYEAAITFIQLIGTPDILLVNDFGDGYEDYDAWFNLFEDAGVAPEIQGSNAANQIGIDSYSKVIWATSTDEGDVLTDDDISLLTDYMDNGGKLILTGEEIGEDEASNQWFVDYFHSHHRLDAPPSTSQLRLIAVDGSPFPTADFILVGGNGHSTDPSTLTLDEGGVPFVKYMGTTEIGAAGYRDETYAAIYLAFNFQAISGVNESTMPEEALQMLFDWLDGVETAVPENHGETALPQNLELSAYPNPFNAALTVHFNLPSAGQAQVSVYNLLGREVARLAQGSFTAGLHTVSWQADHTSSGIYLVRIDANGESALRKVSLIK